MSALKLLESQDPNDWREDPIEERLRAGLTIESGQMLVRQLYPLRARLTQRCVFNSQQPGYVFQYARTSWAPSLYPIQVFDLEQNGTPHRWCFSSAEVEILPVAEG